jgi:hypothetical protein
MLAHCETRRPFTLHLSNRVVEGIIRDVLLKNGVDDSENVRAPSMFQKSSQEDDEIAGYVAEVKNVEQFLLSLGYLQFTASFRAVSGMLQVTMTITGMSRIGSCTTVEAARVARIACAVNLEKISELMCAALAFYIALDTSTAEGTGYLNFCVRVYVKTRSKTCMYLQYLCAIIILERSCSTRWLMYWISYVKIGEKKYLV